MYGTPKGWLKWTFPSNSARYKKSKVFVWNTREFLLVKIVLMGFSAVLKWSVMGGVRNTEIKPPTYPQAKKNKKMETVSGPFGCIGWTSVTPLALS